VRTAGVEPGEEVFVGSCNDDDSTWQSYRGARLATPLRGVHDVGEAVLSGRHHAQRRIVVRTVLICVTLLALVASFAVDAVARRVGAAEPQLAHMVFFALKDHSKESREQFIASCEKLLADHEGTVYFSVGTIAEDKDVQEPVSVTDFDVALHVVFENKAAKAKYLVSERHKQFVDENREHFAGVRVFDSFLKPSKSSK
jgi:Stress responsive A/B Barrel Domain